MGVEINWEPRITGSWCCWELALLAAGVTGSCGLLRAVDLLRAVGYWELWVNGSCGLTGAEINRELRITGSCGLLGAEAGRKSSTPTSPSFGACTPLGSAPCSPSPALARFCACSSEVLQRNESLFTQKREREIAS